MSALIWCLFPSRETARAASESLLTEGLIACANLIAPVESLYVWRGAVECAEEVAALMKTRADVLAEAIVRLEALHPYSEPAIFGWEADKTGAACTEWLAKIAPLGPA